jgi:hypothetical protein
MSDPWRDAYGGLQSDGAASCPDAERLCALVLGEFGQADRLELADHVVACRRCSETMRDLLELHGEAALDLPIASARRTRAWRVAAAAAVVVLALGLTLVVRRSGGPPVATPSAMRGSVGEAAGLEPTDHATLATPPLRLEWPAQDGAVGYSVVLYDFEATPIWDSPLVAVPAVEVPEAVRARIVSGRTYYWRVTTLVGIERRQSDLHRFTLGP